jgi:CDP-paratose 2-epimerase
MSRTAPRAILVTGGAGFVGSNLAHALASDGFRVCVYDNLSRPGVRDNVAWLQAEHGGLIELVEACITDRLRLRRAVSRADAVFHLAAQVAVTTSLVDPLGDLEVNVRGTVELLEAMRAVQRPVPLVFASTNKVYGCLSDVRMRELGRRSWPLNSALARSGIAETRPLAFRSPYGCSKGAADQYVLDYAQSFGLRAAVFRMSCIYGPRQMGCEAQGWVAHLLMQAIDDQPVTIFGSGKQVRDVLYVDDLIRALRLAWRNINRIAGRAFNIGGGPRNALSLLELVDAIEAMRAARPQLVFERARLADQQYYVSDTRAFRRATGWRPRVSVSEGIARLYHWLLYRKRDCAARAAQQVAGQPGGGTLNG